MPSAVLRPAVFLDRDGVIIQNRADYVKSLAEVEFLPGALAAVARLASLGGLVVIVTNQSAIDRGVLSPGAAEAINQHVLAQVQAVGGRVDGIFVCPHRPEAGCACRKPRPGLLLQAAERLGIDLAASVMIGDAVSDLEAGRAAGTQAMLVRTGRGAGQALELPAAGLAHVPVVADLAEAVARLAARHPTLAPS